MIDWLNLAANGLWIGALALALATVSVASWQSALAHQKVRLRLALPGPQAALNLAGLLFCAGLAATSRRWWEIGVWVILGLSFLAQVLAAWFGKRGRPSAG